MDYAGTAKWPIGCCRRRTGRIGYETSRDAGGGGAALAGLSAFRRGPAAAADQKKAQLLYFTQHVVYEHSVIHREPGKPSHSEQILSELGERHGFQIVGSQDGTVLEGDLEQFDAIVLYTCGNLLEPNTSKTPPTTLPEPDTSSKCCTPASRWWRSTRPAIGDGPRLRRNCSRLSI